MSLTHDDSSDPLLALTGLNRGERFLRSSAAVNAMWGTTFDRTARTAAARAGWLEKLADRADPDRLLPQAERTKRAQSLRKAHLQSIALKSAKARRLRAEQKKEIS